MMMRLLILFHLLIVPIHCDNVSNKIKKDYNKDSVFVLTELRRDSIHNSVQISCSFKNLTCDTLLFLPEPFIIQSNISDRDKLWVLSSNSFSTPNIIYLFEAENRINFFGDGEYLPYFHEVPNITIVLPSDSVIVEIDITNEINYGISVLDLNYFGALIYGSKSAANTLLRNAINKSSNSLAKMLDTLKKEPTIEITPMRLNKFGEQFSKVDASTDTALTKLIWDIFNRKAKFVTEE